MTACLCTCTLTRPRLHQNARTHAVHMHTRTSPTVTERPSSGAIIMSDRLASREGCLSPWADPVLDTPGWQITTRSRLLAETAASTVPGGTVRTHEKGQWQARLPQTVLMVVVLGADAGSLRCHLSAAPVAGVLLLTFAPWPTPLVIRCRLATLPAPGRLTVRDVRLTTRMGRTVRYLIPAFTTS